MPATAYFTSRHLLANGVGHRLEYFFWRLLSSRAYERLRGREVARLFAAISRGDIIRTTPKPSPRSSRALWSSGRSPLGESESQLDEDSASAAALTTASHISNAQAFTTTTGDDNGRARPDNRDAQNDLKHDDSRVLSRTQRPRATESSLHHTSATGASTASQASASMERQSSSDSTLKSTRRRAPVFVSSSNRRRPVVARRKSSLSSAAGVARTAAQSGRGRQSVESGVLLEEDSAADLGSQQEERGLDPREIFPPMVIPRHAWPISRSASPVSRNPLRMPLGEDLVYGLASKAGDSPGSNEERKTRNKQDRITSRPSLLGLAGLKSVPALSPASFQAGGRMADALPEDDAQRQNAVEFGARTPANEMAAPQQQRNAKSRALPRTRSQLTELMGRSGGKRD